MFHQASSSCSLCILLNVNSVCIQPKLIQIATQNRWLPWRLYEYFPTRMNALLFDKGCVVFYLSENEKKNQKQIIIYGDMVYVFVQY